MNTRKFLTRSLTSLALGAFCIGSSTAFAEGFAIKPGEPFWKSAQSGPLSVADVQEANPGVHPLSQDIQLPGGDELSISKAPAEVVEAAIAAAASEAVSQAISQALAASAPAAIPAAAPAAVPAAAPANAQPKAANLVKAAKIAPSKPASSKTVSASNTIATPAGPKSYKRVINVKASAYSAAPEENGYYGAIDYFGNPLKLGTIAVDPSVIPLGSTVYITGYSFDGLPAQGMIAKATDIGGAIKGNRIDIFLPGSRQKVSQFGFQNVKVYILN